MNWSADTSEQSAINAKNSEVTLARLKKYFHLQIFKGLNSDRTDIRMKKLKEICSNKSVPNKKRNLDSSKLGNVVVVDIARYSKQLKRVSFNFTDRHPNFVLHV